MSNKNKYNDYFNDEKNQNKENTEEIVIKEDSNSEKDTIVSTDVNEVETIIVPDSNQRIDEIQENSEINDFVGYSQVIENSENIDNNEESLETVQCVKVNTRALNIRKEPNKESDIVTIVYKDESLILCESKDINGFYKVKTNNGFDGYCMVQFVDLV